ncbi:MAG: response regulator transcription factor [Deltaproteobacteria bacterium]|nr:response regulator transcription factor [Deltaproteobacteria bacterium]
MSQTLTALVVDDEERARRRLVRLLAAYPQVRVAGEAASGTEAVAAIARLAPDIVFLDVQMPDLDGLAVLAQLTTAPRYVVFTTAYDRYAIEAFAVGAVDHLLKPFGEREVGRAVQRAMERDAGQRFREGYDRLVAVLDRPRFIERIPVTWLKDIVLVPVEGITHFEADQEMVAIHTPGATYSTELTLAELEQRLDPARFLRVHRRAIVNLERIVRLERIEGTRLLAVLGQDVRVELSRQGSRKLRERLGIR